MEEEDSLTEDEKRLRFPDLFFLQLEINRVHPEASSLSVYSLFLPIGSFLKIGKGTFRLLVPETLCSPFLEKGVYYK